MRISILAPYPLSVAPSQRTRFEQYLPLLRAAGVEVDVLCFMPAALWKIRAKRGMHLAKVTLTVGAVVRRCFHLLIAWKADVVVVHREALPLGWPIFEWLLSRVARTPIVYDFDDPLYLGEYSRTNRLKNIVVRPRKTQEIVGLSSVVIAGNRPLAEFARRFNGNVEILPATYDTEQIVPQSRIAPSRRIRVVFNGSVSTVCFLDAIAPALRRVGEAYPDQVLLQVLGDATFQCDYLPFESFDWTESLEHSILGSADIGIMPIPEGELGRARVAGKAVHLMAYGVPSVCSANWGYADVVLEGEHAYFAANLDEWFEKLSRLISRPAERIAMGSRGRKLVEERFSRTALAPRFLQILEAAASTDLRAGGRTA